MTVGAIVDIQHGHRRLGFGIAFAHALDDVRQISPDVIDQRR